MSWMIQTFKPHTKCSSQQPVQILSNYASACTSLCIRCDKLLRNRAGFIWMALLDHEVVACCSLEFAPP